MRPIRHPLFAAALLASPVLPAGVPAQVIDLTVHDVGVAIGDKPRVTGLRLNFRDRNLVEVKGVNVTVWTPYEPPSGVVNGLALGIPVTGAREVNGFLVGLLGGGVGQSMTGIGIGGVGIGGGGQLRGIMLGGIGVGSGGGITGLSIGGVGVGSGGAMRGIQIGGIGVGGGGSVSGISIGGVGVGSGGDVSGLAVGGIGVGSGGRMTGVGIGGIGVGAPSIKGIAVGGLGVGGVNVHALVLTAGYFKIDADGRFRGSALAAVSNIKGAQHGLTVGLFNYARELRGAQIGLINISDNGGHRRILPVISVR